MNLLFSLLFIFSALLFLVFSPEKFLEAALTGGEAATSLTIKMLAVYAFWLGIMKIAEALGLENKLAGVISPIIRRVIGKTDEETEKDIALNLSCNMLGLGNMATPYALSGMKRLCEGREKIPDSAAVFFVINATSVQLIPTTVIALRASSGSLFPYDIFLPSFIVGISTTVLGVILVKVFSKER